MLFVFLGKILSLFLSFYIHFVFLTHLVDAIIIKQLGIGYKMKRIVCFSMGTF